MLGSDLRLAVIGLSGSGKSTCAGIVERCCAEKGLTFARIKLAKPLYDLQKVVYNTARMDLPDGAQDQALMEALAEHLRRIRPDSLAADFLRRLDSTSADVVLNDDLRDPRVDAPALRAQGFRILRVKCDEGVRRSRLARRDDLTISNRSTEDLDLIAPDLVLDNSRDLATFEAAVREILGGAR